MCQARGTHQHGQWWHDDTVPGSSTGAETAGAADPPHAPCLTPCLSPAASLWLLQLLPACARVYAACGVCAGWGSSPLRRRTEAAGAESGAWAGCHDYRGRAVPTQGHRSPAQRLLQSAPLLGPCRARSGSGIDPLARPELDTRPQISWRARVCTASAAAAPTESALRAARFTDLASGYRALQSREAAQL